MIVATAGHVDHGKTLLVKALTGTDADRLPEEKRRGMTIDLGFAYWPAAPQTVIGFVDVPGHERFIRNMLCGIIGIDVVLLIVASDDGIMPQTREHVAIADLLGVARGAVALTKIDRVAPERVAQVERDVVELLADTSLAQAAILPVSSVTGEGIAALKTHLVALAAATPVPPPCGNFRLAVDRCFTVVGAGLVVTGTVFSGAVAVGDTVRLLLADRTARVRSIHAQNAAAAAGRTGERCALNLTGADLHVEQIARGDWIVAPEAPQAVSKLDVNLRVLASEQRPLAHWTAVHVHLGAADATGRVALLGGDAIASGGSGLAQLVLDKPVGAVFGDRVIVRDQSAQRTIGGGTVIDIHPPRRGRARPERLAQLHALAQHDDAAALAGLLADAPAGVDLARFANARNLTQPEADALFARFAHGAMKMVADETGRWGFAPAQWERLKGLALDALAAAHRRAPAAAGPSEERLFLGTPARLPPACVRAIAADLVAAGAVIRSGAGLHLPTHTPRLAAADVPRWRRVEPVIDANQLRPPSVHEIAASLREEPAKLEALLVRAARVGLLVRVAPNRFFRPAALRELAVLAVSSAAASPARCVTAAAFRDRAGIGRNVAIELLEYFDRIKFTRRVGDAHEVVRHVEEAFGSAA